MDLLIIPFHDWRKIMKEGFRTRDAHFIEVLSDQKGEKKIIVNRPITILEMVIKKKTASINGKLLLKRGGATLYEIGENMYLIDVISKNFVKQIIQKHIWYVHAYSENNYVSFIKDSLNHLGIQEYALISQNVFAYKLVSKLKASIYIFDAWDNFMKFKVYKAIVNQLEEGYKSYAQRCNFWITNAKENIEFFYKKFSPKHIHLIANGVDLKRFVYDQAQGAPEDLQHIKRPIAGFGGKITHLLDVDLINQVIKMTPNISFVFVGQILDKDIFSQIKQQSNFYYLGDKHYDIYPNYVKNFDICIVPYVTEDDQKSGANSIKVYEYLATGKKVVGTLGNGLEFLKEYLYLAQNAEEFSTLLQETDNRKKKIDLNFHSWNHKVACLDELILNEKTKK